MSRSKRPDNKTSELLSADENYVLFSALAQDSFSLATGVVQLLFSTAKVNGDWRREGTGVACLVKDYTEKAYFIRVVDIMNKGACVFDQFLYDDFHADKPHNYLITFEGDDCRVGLNFSSEDEATHFKTSLDKRRKKENESRKSMQQPAPHLPPNAPPSRPPPPPSTGVPSSTYPQFTLPAGGNPQQQMYPAAGQTTTGVFASSAPQFVSNEKTKKKKKNKKDKKMKFTKADIGFPTNFEHKVHVGWNEDQGFQSNSTANNDDLDPEVRELLDKIGFGAEDVEKQKKFIYNFIEEKGGIDKFKKEMRMSTVPAPAPPRQRPERPAIGPVGHGAPTPPMHSREMSRAPPPPSRPLPPTPHSYHSPQPVRPSNVPPPPPAHVKSAAPRPPASSSAPPPPPPPPPMSGGGPPPPPPPPPMAGGKGGGAPQGRGALLDQIRLGASLKSVEPDQPSSSSTGGGGGRGALLSAIQHGKQLKHVDSSERQHGTDRLSQQPEDLGGIAGALARALAERRDKIQDSSGDDSSDSDDDWNDDDEWND